MNLPLHISHQGAWRMTNCRTATHNTASTQQTFDLASATSFSDTTCPLSTVNTDLSTPSKSGSPIRHHASLGSGTTNMLRAQPSLMAAPTRVNMTTNYHPWLCPQLSASPTAVTLDVKPHSSPSLPGLLEQNSFLAGSGELSPAFWPAFLSGQSGFRDRAPSTLLQQDFLPSSPLSHEDLTKHNHDGLHAGREVDQDRQMASLVASLYPCRSTQWQMRYDQSSTGSSISQSSRIAPVQTETEALPQSINHLQAERISNTSRPHQDPSQLIPLGLHLPGAGQMNLVSTGLSTSAEIAPDAEVNRHLHGLDTLPRKDISVGKDFEDLLAEANLFLDGKAQQSLQCLSSAGASSSCQEPAASLKSRPSLFSTIERTDSHQFSRKPPFMDTYAGQRNGVFGLTESLPHHFNPMQNTSAEQASAYCSDRSAGHLRSADVKQPVTPAHLGLTSKPNEQTDRAMALNAASSCVFILDRRDGISWSSDTVRLCSSALHHRRTSELDIWTRHRGGCKFSDLLADQQTISIWYRACREVLLRDFLLKRASSTTLRGTVNLLSAGKPTKKLILRLKSHQSQEAFVEVTVMAVGSDALDEEGCLMVQVRRVMIPVVAPISSQPTQARLGSIRNEVRESSQSLPVEEIGVSQLRLLVSRYGLILRSTCSFHSVSSPKSINISQQDQEDRVASAILGQGASPPTIGQSLVEVVQLTPLLHVIAQAAVVGLARTLKLSRNGREVNAIVQPVLRRNSTNTSGPQRKLQPAAKVWVTLSAPAMPTRSSQSGPSMSSAGFASRFAEFIGMAPLREHSSHDRRRSLEDPSAPTWQTMMASCADRQTSIAHLSPPAAMTVDGEQGCSDPSERPSPKPLIVKDSLGVYMVKLREENELLRQAVEARLCRLREQAAQPNMLSRLPTRPCESMDESHIAVQGSCSLLARGQHAPDDRPRIYP